jgi:hypothetical protein
MIVRVVSSMFYVFRRRDWVDSATQRRPDGVRWVDRALRTTSDPGTASEGRPDSGPIDPQAPHPCSEPLQAATDHCAAPRTNCSPGCWEPCSGSQSQQGGHAQADLPRSAASVTLGYLSAFRRGLNSYMDADADHLIKGPPNSIHRFLGHWSLDNEAVVQGQCKAPLVIPQCPHRQRQRLGLDIH